MTARPIGMAAALLYGIPAVAVTAEFDTPIIFENDHVRVTEIFAAPGARVATDGLLPRVIVSFGKARLESRSPDGTPLLVDYGPGQILWRDPAVPRHARLVAGNAHLFIVELKRPPVDSPPPPLASDHSTIVDPDQHHLLLDNDHVRVIDGMAPPGARSARHSHPPSVLVSFARSRFRVTIDGKTRIFDFEPATVRWTNHFRHEWEILAGEARVVMIEIKSADGDPRFRRPVRENAVPPRRPS